MGRKNKSKVSRNAKNNEILHKKKILLFFMNLLFYVVMLSIFFGATIMAIMQKQDKSLNGYRMFGVLTNSMVSPDNSIKEGGFRAGDIIILKEVEAKYLKKGDVITYRPNTNPNNKKNNYLTHRVIKVQNGLKSEKGYFITTRGDANTTDDMPVSEKALVGKVVGKVPKVGAILSYVKENFVLSVIFILSVVGFFWVIRIYIISGDDTSKEIKHVEVSPEKPSTRKNKHSHSERPKREKTRK